MSEISRYQKRKKNSDTNQTSTKTPKCGGQGKSGNVLTGSCYESVSDCIRQANSVLFNQSITDMKTSVFSTHKNRDTSKSVKSSEQTSSDLILIEYLKRLDKKMKFINKQLNTLVTLERQVSSFAG